MSELIFNNAIFSEVEGKINNAFKGNYDKEYEDGYAYANDRNRNDQPMIDGKGTIAISWSENAWNEVVNKNREAFAQMTKEEIDDAYQWFEGGFQYGMIAGSKLHTNSRKAPHGTKVIKSSRTIREVRDLAEEYNGYFQEEGLEFRWKESPAYNMLNFILVLPNDGRGAAYANTGYGSKDEVYHYLINESRSVLDNIEWWKEKQERILGGK